MLPCYPTHGSIFPRLVADVEGKLECLLGHLCHTFGAVQKRRGLPSTWTKKRKDFYQKTWRTRFSVKTHFHHKNLCFTGDFFFPQLWGSEHHVLMRGELRQRWRDGSQGKNIPDIFRCFAKWHDFFFANFHGNSPATYCNSVGCLRMRWGSSTSAQNLQVEKLGSFVVSSWMTLTWTQFTRKHSGHASHDFGFLGLPLSTFETCGYLQCQVQFSMTNHSLVAPHALYSHERLSSAI